ncbi:hypothetical protein [Magnetospirillum molischianum]|uniref:Uncharacterized protein n=1 Tax=Magnetospirillum molischianum DSM 120 TaxID=1150626 RepID=H8FN71_MAGML|nr:hypothetical protein [Magnetospirillum molischianum]CCG39809.1 conserved hypothetical protein [Magnetospirillum molischianum DSM 120]
MFQSSPHVERQRLRRTGDRAVTIGCVIWLVASGWLFFGTVPPEIVDNHTSKAMQQRMRVCEGTFQQRFECKQAFLLSGERWGFAVAINRLMLMCAPAVTAWIVWSILRRRIA